MGLDVIYCKTFTSELEKDDKNRFQLQNVEFISINYFNIFMGVEGTVHSSGVDPKLFFSDPDSNPACYRKKISNCSQGSRSLILYIKNHQATYFKAVIL